MYARPTVEMLQEAEDYECHPYKNILRLALQWFNMGRITNNDLCLIKTIKTEYIVHNTIWLTSVITKHCCE